MRYTKRLLFFLIIVVLVLLGFVSYGWSTCEGDTNVMELSMALIWQL